jgi:hypothetical protein
MFHDAGVMEAHDLRIDSISHGCVIIGFPLVSFYAKKNIAYIFSLQNLWIESLYD